MSVDLPAPFSPISACTSPGITSKSTPSTASIPGKRFDTPSMLNADCNNADAIAFSQIPSPYLFK